MFDWRHRGLIPQRIATTPLNARSNVTTQCSNVPDTSTASIVHHRTVKLLQNDIRLLHHCVEPSKMKTFAVLAVLTALLAVASAQHGARALRQQMG